MRLLGGRIKARVERDVRGRRGEYLQPLPPNKRSGPVLAVPAPACRTVIEGDGKQPAVRRFCFPSPGRARPMSVRRGCWLFSGAGSASAAV